VTTATRIYKIQIIYPEGCREPGWHPARWTDPEYLGTLTREKRREVRKLLRQPFKWPRERLFLSSSGAYYRAWLLRFYGAEAEVIPSNPVTWPNLDDAATGDRWDQLGGCAARMPGEADLFADARAQLVEAETFALLTPEEDLAAEQAEQEQEQEREWLRGNASMYRADTAAVVDEHARFHDYQE
jgi:hypothetical protein